MTTELQAQANVRNAQHATGPVSEEGKARAARNALRHGYCAADIVMPGEDAADFARLHGEVAADWAPASPAERELADELAVTLWRRRRLRRVEAELWAARTRAQEAEPLTLGEAFAQDADGAGNAIEKLRRWWNGNERHLHRCLDKLALVKRLARSPGGARPPEAVREQRRHAAREFERLLAAPPPGASEDAPRESRIGNSAEQTQSSHAQADQPLAARPAQPRTRLSDDAPAPRRPLGRRERRALERQQAKAARRKAAA